MARGLNRRQFLSRAGAAAVGLGGLLSLLRATADGPAGYAFPDVRRRGLLRPPGSAEEAEFLARCIRCQRCAEVCETRAIRLGEPGWGSLAGTPYIVAESHACDLCLKCGPACPTGAIGVLGDKADARMGLAVVDERLCVSHNGSGICGACFTVCPLKGKAIVQGMRNAPKVDGERCVGCGLCEEACIVDDPKGGRAIRVRSPRGFA